MARFWKPTGTEYAPLWEIRTAWVLRALILVTAALHMARGQWLFTMLCLVALALILVPPLLARSSRLNIPLEIELGLLWWLVTDMTLGRLMQFYGAGIFYDKIIHFGNSGLLAMVAFLGVYTLSMTGRLRIGTALSLATIFFVTLGVGALWEIAEFVSDNITGENTQGSPLMSPLEDTMWDLIVDGAGGFIGGGVGAAYMRVSKRSLARWRCFMARLAG
ncbi:hypothetical protein [Tranquillimonas alkanivorans]|uniref:Membrane protein YjdF n=1 Tax=Tranquillimonas alkanivorans TaxID=441119 RepID=A0A1I5V756_9RHOB|nr:hypothetical protein [Tranquillimonas alkanivorans]SFQ02796.1 hypothetical protein SAMN04488047_12734 [Tranquillimonas alkanivorans]